MQLLSSWLERPIRNRLRANRPRNKIIIITVAPFCTSPCTNLCFNDFGRKFLNSWKLVQGISPAVTALVYQRDLSIFSCKCLRDIEIMPGVSLYFEIPQKASNPCTCMLVAGSCSQPSRVVGLQSTRAPTEGQEHLPNQRQNQLQRCPSPPLSDKHRS
jgi:hypothetical protein